MSLRSKIPEVLAKRYRSLLGEIQIVLNDALDLRLKTGELPSKGLSRFLRAQANKSDWESTGKG